MMTTQTKPWDFMVKYTPQREWIEGHGILVAFAMFFGGISGGLYLASLAFDDLLGMFIAWLLAMAAGITDMMHLSKPMRFWRMMLKPGTSWISRGFILIWLFLGAAMIQLALAQWAPGAAETVFRVLAGILAFGVAIYSGFVVGFVGAIKLWNSAVIPMLYVITGLTGGLAVLLLASFNDDALLSIANYFLAALVAYAVLLAVYFWVATYGGVNARDSAVRVLRGNIAPAFWLGVVLLGIVIPIAMVAPLALAQNTSTAVFAVASVCAIIGGMMLRYVILKGGLYSPLLPDE
jgi:formate-dependent nitrite reductase membrane component NrfD